MKNDKKVLIIGVDGASPELIQKAIQEGKMKFMSELLELNKNKIIKLKSTLPSSTAPAWTSMMTGVNPGKHGIYDFLIHEGIKTRLAKYTDVKKPFIWDILSRHGLKSVVIGHPITYPVKRDENIVMVSGILAPELNENAVHPIDLLDILNAKNYTIDIEEKMPLLKTSPQKAVEICNESATKRLNVTKKILKNYEWDFGFILFPESDRLLHYHISKENCLFEHFKTIDKIIKNLVLIDDNLIVFVVSDHGFVKINKVFTVNSFLYNLGLCKIASNITRGIILNFGKKIIRSKLKLIQSFLSHFNLIKKFGNIIEGKIEGKICREESKAWFTPYAESGIRLNPNLPEDEKVKILNFLLDFLNNLKDPSTGNIIVRAFKREDVYWGNELYKAPDIVLLPLKNYVATHLIPNKLDKILFEPKEVFLKEGDHVCEFSQYGILVAGGLKLDCKRYVRIWDVAPTILDIFGVNINSYPWMDGQPLTRR